MNPTPIERRMQLDQRAAIQAKLDAGFQIESRDPMVMVKGDKDAGAAIFGWIIGMVCFEAAMAWMAWGVWG